MRTVTVSIPERSYPVLIGAGARHRLAGLIGQLRGVERVAVVADQHVAELHLQRLLDGMRIKPAVLLFPPGEQSKSLTQLARLYGELAQARVARGDLILTFGGGVAGDLGGLAAATWMRGVRFVQVPTSLEAAVDASVGGKTSVDHPAGKNLIGAFHQPSAVVVDTDFLETLPQRDYVAGLAESVKHAVVRAPAFFEWHEAQVQRVVARDPEALEELIARNCQIKAEVVARDEREEHLRAILNHGHTLGHAFEHLLGYELRHGECVGLGMLAENELARARGMLAEQTARRIAGLIERLGLPTRLPRRLESEAVAHVCELDKKVRGEAVNFVLARALGEPQRVSNITAEELRAALRPVQPVCIER